MVPTLYEWAGGDSAFERLINCFYDRVERDDLISPLFSGGVSPEHREHVIAWWQEVFGGPARYSEELGGYAAMVAKHLNLGITAEQRRRAAVRGLSRALRLSSPRLLQARGQPCG